MGTLHSRFTVWKIGSNTISAFLNGSDLTRTADSHDVTTYGKSAHVYTGGLLDGSGSLQGFYDTTAVSGPRAVIEPLIGTVAEITHWPEGAGSGKPSDVFDALITSYKESKPIADMVTFTVDFQISDDVDSTAQAS